MATIMTDTISSSSESKSSSSSTTTTTSMTTTKTMLGGNSNSNSSGTLWKSSMLLVVVVAYLAGYVISSQNGNIHLRWIRDWLTSPWILGRYDILHGSSTTTSTGSRFLSSVWKQKFPETEIVRIDNCYQTLARYLDDWSSSSSNFVVAFHRNGEAEPCGNIQPTPSSSTSSVVPKNWTMIELYQAVREHIHDGHACYHDEKYTVESILTRWFHKLTTNACQSTEDDRSSSPELGLYGYCDMGKEKTPILPDHSKLIPININTTMTNAESATSSYLPCHFHDAHGVRITSFPQLAELVRKISRDESSSKNPQDAAAAAAAAAASSSTETSRPRTLDVYAVPAGRVFLHAAAYVGQIIPLPHVRGGDPEQLVYLQVLSTSPAVFDLHNFFTKQEAEQLLAWAMAETRESHRIKRSSTGASGYNLNERRTSESGFDTSSPTSMAIKRRCFDVLGFDTYIESFADGLQILRYNLTKAYIPHMDYLDIGDQFEHDYDSGATGGNRFATILLYFTDLGENDGGETVFTEAWPVGQAEEDHVDIDSAIRQLRESEEAGVLRKGSWEETMVAKCRSRLAIRPQAGRAVLFYSQLPNGKADPNSLHGGCPVLRGTKYAANLWTWNTPRDGYSGNPKNPKYKRDENKAETPGRVLGIFRNSGADPKYNDAELYYSDGSFWGKLGPNDSVRVNTYESHVWTVKVNGEDLKTFTVMSSDPETQEFVV